MLLQLAYIVMVRAYPISDQSVVQRIASSFLDGDYSELTGKGYLVAYPQQLGIIGIIQIIYYIFGKDNYIAIMLFNVLAMAGIFNMLYKILTKMTDNIRIHNLYWVMVFGCFPLIFYSFFVYGTIFGLFFSLVGFYNLILAKENGKMIGDCGLTLQPIGNTIKPEIGYHIQKTYQRKGYAKEAAIAVRDWAFTHTPFQTIYSYMNSTILPSMQTAQAYGCQRVY